MTTMYVFKYINNRYQYTVPGLRMLKLVDKSLISSALTLYLLIIINHGLTKITSKLLGVIDRVVYNPKYVIENYVVSQPKKSPKAS